MPLIGYFVTHEMGLAKIYSYTKFKVPSFTRSKDMAHWLTRGSPSFLSDPTKFGVTIVEWSVLYANVLDLRYVFALSNYGANCLRLGMGFSAPVRFRRHFEKIGIAKVLLNTKPRRVGKFQGCRFSDVWESVAREKNKNKLSVKYNGSLTLAALERATIITQ